MTGHRSGAQVASYTVRTSIGMYTAVTLPASFGAVDRVTVSPGAGAGSAAGSEQYLMIDDVVLDVRGLVPAGTERIAFDDLPPLPESCDSSAPVPAAYRGLKWDNAYYMGVCASRPAPPTGPNAAFNGTFRQYFLMGAVPLSVPRRLYAQVSILHDPAPCG